MEENNVLEEVNTEPLVQLVFPQGDGKKKVFSVTRKKAMTLAGLFAVVFACLVGAAGFYVWKNHLSKMDNAVKQEYLANRS